MGRPRPGHWTSWCCCSCRCSTWTGTSA
jgi:hypothetical protein